MAIQITLPPETERRLQAEVDATGKDIAKFVAEAVEARLSLSKLGLHDILAPAHADFRKSGMTDAELESLLSDAIVESRSTRKPSSDSAA